MEALILDGHESPRRLNGSVLTAEVAGSNTGPLLMRYFTAMSQNLGPMRWWPARTPFEVIVGAILTQNTSWGNGERAIANLRSAQMLTPSAISAARMARLAALVRPSGYFRQKAKKLKAFVRFLQQEHGGSMQRVIHATTEGLRREVP